ncbi:MAG: terminase, partial [Terracidiphilus sp.]
MTTSGAEALAAAKVWFPRPIEINGAELKRWGTMLDRMPASLGGGTVAMALAQMMLRVRTRDGRTQPLRMNAAQRVFEQSRAERNIVLKARQMGITTWAAARFFLKTITQPGTLTLEVTHTQESAEEIFRIVHRFVDCMPAALREGPLRTSRASVRRLVFPEIDSQYLVISAGERNAGRGLTVQNLHCSEVARWPGDAAETLAGLRAALPPQAEVILESTPDGAGGCFYEEWTKAAETGTVRHFLPWWLEPRYRAKAVEPATLTQEELDLMARAKLDLEQIAFRRRLRRNFRSLAMQEYAEDAESCFRASGDSVFELSAIEARLATAPAPVELRRNGQLAVWLPPLPGKNYLVAVDPAGGGAEGDYSAAQVIEMETGLQCAEFAAHLPGAELAELMVKLATEYNQAWLVVERNNHGHGIVALIDFNHRYERLYRQGGQAGWLTTSVSRPAVLGRFDAALVDKPECFQSRALLAECRT